MSDPTYQTYSAKCFDLASPDPYVMDIGTIAHVMSVTRRFGGHCQRAYTLADHTIHVYELLHEQPREIQVVGLIHDIHEIYDGFGDVISPAKRLMPPDVRMWYDMHVSRVNIAICQFFGVDHRLLNHPEVHRADLKALATEKRDILGLANPDVIWCDLPEPDEKILQPRKDAKRLLADLLWNIRDGR